MTNVGFLTSQNQRLQTRIAKLNEENAYLRERHAEAVAQIPATIEVLEAFNPFSFKWEERMKAHLEHLKALAKEAEV